MYETVPKKGRHFHIKEAKHIPCRSDRVTTGVFKRTSRFPVDSERSPSTLAEKAFELRLRMSIQALGLRLEGLSVQHNNGSTLDRDRASCCCLRQGSRDSGAPHAQHQSEKLMGQRNPVPHAVLGHQQPTGQADVKLAPRVCK